MPRRQTRLISSTFVALSRAHVERARSKKSVSLMALLIKSCSQHTAAGTGVFENADGVNSHTHRMRESWMEKNLGILCRFLYYKKKLVYRPSL